MRVGRTLLARSPLTPGQSKQVCGHFIMPGPNEPTGFVLTGVLGIVGTFLATFIGQAVGWYGPNEGAGLIGAVVGTVIVLAVWSLVTGQRMTRR